MLEIGRVVEVRGETALVQMIRTAACASCGKCASGHQSSLMQLEARNPVGAGMGDMVKLDTEGLTPLRAAFVVYLLPLLMAGVGYAIGSILSPSAGGGDSPYGLVGMGAMFALAFPLIRLYDQYLTRTGRGRPVITEVLSLPGEE
ncbi:MAG: SoxR reducing system RseC family protein [Bacillota bacterium]